jgi:hypothetical protein
MIDEPQIPSASLLSSRIDDRERRDRRCVKAAEAVVASVLLCEVDSLPASVLMARRDLETVIEKECAKCQ